MSRLWERGDPLDPAALRFTVGRDPELDRRLVAFDALGSAAHARMLERIGVLSASELGALVAELGAIAREARAGQFTIDPEEEDGHTAIENRLTARLGDAGRRIHTGRSRNDQVITALRLYGREALLEIGDRVLHLVATLLELAARHRETSVAGYSHTRQAMPSTLGFLFAAHAASLLDDLPWLWAAFRHLDRCPLGSASGYGVPLPLDRELVRDLLCFAAVQENALSVQNDRGKTELLVLSSCLAPALDLGRLAADLIWFSSDELGYVRLDATVTTGSSLMPQKRNPDVLELVRASAARLRALAGEVGGILGGLSSGYHRDLQLTKGPFLEGLETCAAMCAALVPVLETLEVDSARCRAAVLPTTAATDLTLARVAAGVPFRSAYAAVAGDPETLAAAGAAATADLWRERTHLGAPGALDLEPSRRALDQARAELGPARERITRAWEILPR